MPREIALDLLALDESVASRRLMTLRNQMPQLAAHEGAMPTLSLMKGGGGTRACIRRNNQLELSAVRTFGNEAKMIVQKGNSAWRCDMLVAVRPRWRHYPGRAVTPRARIGGVATNTQSRPERDGTPIATAMLRLETPYPATKTQQSPHSSPLSWIRRAALRSRSYGTDAPTHSPSTSRRTHSGTLMLSLAPEISTRQPTYWSQRAVKVRSVSWVLRAICPPLFSKTCRRQPTIRRTHSASPLPAQQLRSKS